MELESRVLARLGVPATGAAERERLSVLRQQAEHYDPRNRYSFLALPERFASLRTLTDADPDAVKQRVDGFRELLREPVLDADAAFWLAQSLPVFVGRQPDALERALAVAHTALDLLDDPGHQHMLRCVLAGLARNQEDFRAAADWLALANPAPTELDLDSEYRSQSAGVAAEHREWSEVLALVGEKAGDVPFEPASINRALALRAVALERLGRSEEATATMRVLAQRLHDAPIFMRNYFRGALGVGMRIWARFDPENATGVKRSSMPWMILAIVGVIFVPATIFAVIGLLDARADAEWKPVPATLTLVDTRPSTKSVTYTVLEAQYHYVVDGKSRYGRNWKRDVEDESFANVDNAKKRADELRQAKTIEVYYDPKNPEQSFRERRPMSEAGPPGVIAVTVLPMVLIALGASVMTRNRVRKAAAQLPE